MKILIVTDAWRPQVNGVVRTYEYLIPELEKRGHEVKVISPNDFISCPMPIYPEIRLSLFPYNRLKKLINEYQPDKIHIPVEGPLGAACRRYCKRHKRAFTTSYHTHFPDYVAKRVTWLPKRLRRYLRSITLFHIRRFHKLSAAIMVATPSLEKDLVDWGFKAPMRRLLRGAKLDLFYPGERSLFNDMPRPIHLYVGRVAVEKNIEDFLKADVKGSKIVVGPGPSLEELKRRYPEVIFAGKKTGVELANYYRSADKFVFPSKTDTFGIVILEALASGLPVAAYPVTGPIDIIKDHPKLGCMDEDLETAIKNCDMVGTKEDRVAFIREYYTWEKVAENFEKYLLEFD